MITKDLIPISNADTFLEGIKSDSNVSNSEGPSMYEIKSREYNPCGPFPPTPGAVVERLRLGEFWRSNPSVKCISGLKHSALSSQ